MCVWVSAWGLYSSRPSRRALMKRVRPRSFLLFADVSNQAWNCPEKMRAFAAALLVLSLLAHETRAARPQPRRPGRGARAHALAEDRPDGEAARDAVVLL